jgi:hypothetical protein
MKLTSIAVDPTTSLASALATSLAASVGSLRIHILTIPYDGSQARHDWILASPVSCRLRAFDT